MNTFYLIKFVVLLVSNQYSKTKKNIPISIPLNMKTMAMAC